MENNISGIDKISDLPDALLTHILSFLSPKKAVQTCILSKRWRNTWAYQPVLKFYFEKFVSTADLRNLRGRISKYQVKLDKFVEQVLENRERSLSLDTFKFRCSSIWNSSFCSFYTFAMKCILLALEFKPRVFSVHVYRSVLLDLDFIEPIFTCASLQSISLNLQFSERSEKSLQLNAVNLPRLKRLKLSFIRVDENFVKMLFLGCPALEEVKLFCCYLDAPLLFSQVLNSLVLDSCDLEKNLVISTPSLVHLDIYHADPDGEKFLLENMASLLHAQIRWFIPDDDAQLNLHNHLSKFSMSSQSAQAKYNWPNFTNLKSVQLASLHTSNLFKLLAIFLHKSPNLRKLGLELYPSNCCNVKEISSEEEWRDILPLYEHLEVVEIVKFHKVSEETVYQLIKKLSALVKTIGKIIVINCFTIEKGILQNPIYVCDYDIKNLAMQEVRYQRRRSVCTFCYS